MLQKDIWLSKYFPCGDVYHYQPDADWCGDFPKGFIYAKVSTCDRKTINHLLQNSFFIVETSLLFLQKEGSCVSQKGIFSVRETNLSDRQNVSGLGEEAFKNARFYQDPYIDNHISSRIKRDWVDNFYTGERGSHLFVCENKGGSLAGFILLKNNVIDLIATVPEYLGKGVATELILYANERLGPLKAGTQSVNTASVRLYSKNNFFLNKTSFIFHRHQ